MKDIIEMDGTLPPGTERIETSTGTSIVLVPLPTNDPNQPLNWPKSRKALHMTLLCLYCVFAFAVLTSATPIWVPINLETGVSLTNLTNAYATSSATLSVGCLVFMPLALKIGRRPIYLVTALLLVISAIWQGRAYTTGDFIGANFISGMAGAVNEALFQVTVSDMFFVHQRASMNGIYLASVAVGNYLGPVVAGYVADSQGWRWVFYYLTIFMGLTLLVMVFCLEETKYVSPLLQGHSGTPTSAPCSISIEAPDNKPPKDNLTELGLCQQQTQVSTGVESPISIKSYWQRLGLYTPDDDMSGRTFLRHILQPFAVLVRFPAVAFTALQYGWLVSMLSVVAVTQATIYPAPPYNFSPASVGLMSLPPAIGAVIGSLLGGPLIDRFTLFIAKRRGGIHEPEVRLWFFLVPGFGMVVGTLMYGLTIAKVSFRSEMTSSIDSKKGVPWIVNAIGAGFVGFALGGCGDMALTYVQDSYQHILGDALVGVVFVRNAISTGMIFAVPPWMLNMGVYNMFVLCGVLAAVIALTSVPLTIWGRQWRILLSERYEKYAGRQ